MARPLRVDLPGAIQHVTNRGNNRQDIFQGDPDKALFLELFVAEADRCGWLIRDYCLMDNHFHLLFDPSSLRSSGQGLQRRICRSGCKRLQTTYAQRINERHGRLGTFRRGSVPTTGTPLPQASHNLKIRFTIYGMIERVLGTELRRAATQLPVVTITGPRQSGKTTLCRMTFPDKPYVNLERIDTRELAQEDPRGFLAGLADGAIIDEVQHVPDLLSYIQADVDEDSRPGRFILTGSQQLPLNAAISQTLAGRTAILHLLPFSLEERRQTQFASDELWIDIFRGSYPRVYDQQIDPQRWYADYITTYVERDVHQLKDIGDLRAFRTFLRLAAGRTGQEVVLSKIAGDAGITHPTVKSWLGVLEASFLVITAPGWYRNIRKQIVKSPKLHFLDSGIICSLLGIRDPDQLRTHPLRGAIFESWVAGELLKAFVHSGSMVDLKHFRETRGLEIDIVIERGLTLNLLECKSGATMQRSFLEPLKKARSLIGERVPEARLGLTLVYGGEESQTVGEVEICGWKDIGALAERMVSI